MRLKRRPRVARVAPALEHESGPPFELHAKNVAVVAHWSEGTRLTRSVQTLLSELTSSGFRCVLVSSSSAPGPLAFDSPDLAGAVTVLRRPNVGYDFGSWAAFLHAFPEVRQAPRVLLANDSLVGPFASLAGILADFDRCPADIWGLVGTTQDAPHLQSHFVGYRDGVLASPVLSDFWEDVRIEPTKRRLIQRYEIGMSQMARREGFVTVAHFPWHWVTTRGQNPTSLGWRRLIDVGFPFVKRELVLRPPPEVPDAHQIEQVVRERWGQDVYEWV